MSSLGNILSTARSAIHAHQTAVAVASQNVSNAQTEGYSRQRVTIAPGAPQRTTYGMLGTGVRVQNVARMRDTVLDETYRRDAGRAASQEYRKDLLGQLEGVLGEPSETGIGATLDAFWSAWSNLANEPSSGAAKVIVRQRGQEVVNVLNRASTQIGEIETNTRTALTRSIDELNSLARQVRDINVEIVAAEAGGTDAPDLRDARDRLVDRMSKLGEVRVIEQKNGGVAVLVDGEPLVDGSTVRTAAYPSLINGELQIRVNGAPVTFSAQGSSIGEMLRVINEEINGTQGMRAKLDELARGLVTATNALHRQGWSAAGEALGNGSWGAPPTGSMVDFFDPAGLNAREIRLSQEVSANAGVIAAGYTLGGTGDNRLALDLSGLRDAITTMSGGTQSFSGFYRDVVTDLAAKITITENSATVYGTLASQADARRVSISGVSTDEELIQLMQHQQAYAAAGRLLKTVDEMLQTILNF